MSILTQLEHLEILIIRNVRQGGGYIENSQENVTGFIYDQSVTGKEIIKCKSLHTFRLEHTGSIDLMPMIVKQCPLLKDVHLPIYSTDTDLFMLASKCQHLIRVGFKIIGMSDKGLGHLCDAKNLCEVHMLTESFDFVSRVNVFVMQVEDSRRVTQEALVIVDDSWMNIHDDLFIHLSNRK
jgi:hypothetical protein